MDDRMQQRLPGILGQAYPAFTKEKLAQILTKSRRNFHWDFARFIPKRFVEKVKQTVGTQWPVPLGSDLIKVHTSGNRTDYETKVFARQSRLTEMALCAAATGSPDFLDEVIDGVVGICEQLSWCWPAHDDVFEKRGWFIPDFSKPFLDLGAGEVAVQLAIIDLILGKDLDAKCPGLTALIRSRIQERVFAPFETRCDWHWLGIDRPVHNWSAWIHSNLLISALALGGNEQLEVAWKALEGISKYLEVIPPDGSIDEGVGYWWNGVGRALGSLEWLSIASRGDFSVPPDLDNVTASLSFTIHCWLGGRRFVSFADSSPEMTDPVPWGLLARLLDDPLAQELAHQLDPGIDPAIGLHRLLPGFGAGKKKCKPRAPRQELVQFPNLQLAIGRSARAVVTLKGGNNAENHNHNDIGSITYTYDSYPVIVDPGRVTYTASSFGPDRYSTWAYQSCWHSAPRIAGMDQRDGERYHARDFRAAQTIEKVQMEVDVASAYPGMCEGTWRRELTMSKVDGSLIGHEIWANLPGEHQLFFICSGEVYSMGPSKIRLDGEPGTFEIEVSEGTITIHERELTDQIMQKSWGTKLTRIKISIPSGKEKLQWSLRKMTQ